MIEVKNKYLFGIFLLLFIISVVLAYIRIFIAQDYPILTEPNYIESVVDDPDEKNLKGEGGLMMIDDASENENTES